MDRIIAKKRQPGGLPLTWEVRIGARCQCRSPTCPARLLGRELIAGVGAAPVLARPGSLTAVQARQVGRAIGSGLTLGGRDGAEALLSSEPRLADAGRGSEDRRAS